MDPLSQRVAEFLGLFSAREGFDTAPLSLVRFVSSSAAARSTTFAFRVAPSLCNLDDSLHGGAATTLFDNLTPSALFTLPADGAFSAWGGSLGVSRSLKVTFLRPLPRGCDVTLVCEVVSVGRRLALLRGSMRKADDGKVCAVCDHEIVRTENGRL